MTLVDVLRDRSELKHNGITFLKSGGRQDFLSYHALYHSALKVLACLQARGAGPHRELVLQIEDNRDLLIVFWACILGGIIPVPLAVGRNQDQWNKLFAVWALLEDPALVISRDHSEKAARVGDRIFFTEDLLSFDGEGVFHESHERDTAFIQFSSGSTGNPKGVVLTHANLIANMSGIAKAASYTKTDRLLSWMPLTHDMGMIGFHLNPLVCGIDQYLLSTSGFVRDPGVWMDMVSEHRITVTCSPNFGYRHLLKHIGDNRRHWDLASLRIIYNGAEPISETTCREFNERLAVHGLREEALCPVYGLAEASVAVSISDPASKIVSITLDREKLSPGDRIKEVPSSLQGTSFVNVGKPVDQCSIRIADDKNGILGEGRVGRIMIKGANVTGGYYNNPAASRELIDGHGWLNTGDLGFMKDGCLYITGRAKDILFINGQNYYAHDLEREAESIEGVELNKIAVAGFFNAQTQSEEVIAFLLHRGDLSGLVPVARSLRNLVNERFGFELHKVIPVKTIPKTTSGKLQRFQLLKQYIDGEFNAIESEFAGLLFSVDRDEAVVPADEMEERILRIWEAVLQTDTVGVEKQFFHAGGSSLKALELIIQMRQELEVELPIGILYTHSTVRQLAKEIVHLRPRVCLPIPSAKQADTYPISLRQRRIYYAWRMDPASIAYNMPVAIKLRGKVETEKLERCLASLAYRHDVLRMTIPTIEEPVFRIADDADVKLSCIACERSGWKVTLKNLVFPFALDKGSLFRCFLLSDSDVGEHVLLLDFHHIISDGVSARWFVYELMQLYRGESLPPVRVQFRDYAVWEQAYRPERAMKEEEDRKYWVERLSGELPVLELPYDHIRPAGGSMAGRREYRELSGEISAKLRKIAMDQGVTMHALFLTLYNILLTKYSGQTDIITGIPVQVRDHPDLQRMQGLFVNTLPVRCVIKGDDTFSGLLKSIAVSTQEVMHHRDLAFDELVGSLDLSYIPGRNPLFDTMFLYQDMQLNIPAGDLTVAAYPFDAGYSKFDISLEVLEYGDHFGYAFEYSTSLFNEETVRGFGKGFEQIIEQVTGNAEVSIAALSPLGAEELAGIQSFNDTASAPEPFFTVCQLFERQVERVPEKVALQFKDSEITYAELDRKASQVAFALQGKGIQKGDLVGVHMKRSPELIMVLLGILKAGAAYLPLEASMPDERIRYILQDSGCRCLIDDGGAPALMVGPESYSVPEYAGADLAYVIYTSGTTGRPKGVMIEQSSLTNYITWAGRTYVDGEPCSFAFYSSISFDLTVTSLFTPMVTGNRIVIYEEGEAAIIIGQVIRENKADIVKLTPSHLRLLKNNGLLSAGAKVRRFIVGGEALDTQLAGDIHTLMEGKVDILNEYGPTEATVGCMIYAFDPRDTGAAVPIGRPIDNTQIYLLDKDLQHVPVNVPGELYLGGAGLARGYRNNPGLTAEKFIPDPFTGARPGAGCDRLYVTGDMGKRLPNGDLVYIGRNDRQVKINGNRVELAEIESQLVLSGMVKEAIVLIDDERPGRILAWFVPAAGDDENGVPDGAAIEMSLREYLAERLPYYMIPAVLIPLASMPLTGNGKIDTARLKRMEPGGVRGGKEQAGNAIERLFVKAWMDVLRLNVIGVGDNFYELGGDSIKAVQISSRLLEEGISIKPKDILTYPTIASVYGRAERMDGRNRYEQGILEGRFTPTPIQQWLLAQPFVNPHYYNQSVLFRCMVPMDRDVLQNAFTGLIRQHDTLRLNYDREEGVFYYNNGHLRPFVIEEFTAGDEPGFINICEELKDSFDITKSFLIKAALIRDHGNATYLFITAHHLVMDGISWRILIDDLCKAYALLGSGRPLHFPPKTASFKDWSSSLHQFLSSGTSGKGSPYDQGTGAPEPMLPRDLSTGDGCMRDLEKIVVGLGEEDTDSLLMEVHKPYNTDVPILLNAALVMALHQWTGAEEFVIEEESHGRHLDSLDTSRTIGWFTAMYRLRLVYKPQLGELIGAVKESMRKMPAGGPGNVLLQGGNDAGVQPPEVRFNYLGQIELDGDILSLSRRSTGLESDPRNVFTAALELNAMIVKGRFQMEIGYDSRAFKAATITQFSAFFIDGLADILSYLRSEDEPHFTPSDFAHAVLDDQEIRALFGDE